MRLKQLLVLIPLLAILAAAASPELKNISLVAQGNTTVVTIQATGAFRHNDYRPVENIMFVDFPGVSAGKLLDRVKLVQLPGLTGYRVVGFSGAGGVSVARVELNLAPGADVKMSEGSSAVTLEVTGTASLSAKPQPDERTPQGPDSSPAKKDGASQPTPKPVSTARPESASAPVMPADLSLVRNISVTRAEDGMQVEIAGTLPMQPATQTLSNPDRIVIDLPNAAPAGKPRPIKVNAGNVVSVRMGQFQQTPPLTRVVVDLRAPAQFDVAQKGSSVVLKLRSAEPPVQSPPAPAKTENAKPAAPEATEVVTAAKTVETKAGPKPRAVKSAPAKEPKVVAAQAPAPAKKPQGFTKPVSEVEQTSVKPVAEIAQSSAKPAGAPANKPASKGSEEKPPVASAAAEREEKAPTEFVFVQPTYKPKAEADTPAKTTETVPVTSAQKPTLVAMNMQQPAAPAQAQPQAQPQPVQPTAVQPAVNFAAEQRQLQGATIVDKPRYTGEPISVNLKDVDIKDFFRLIHDISGLNIVLDPGVSGSLTLVLDDVPWDQALDIVLKNNGLDRQLEGNVLRIATLDSLRREADLRRAQIQAQALAVDKVSVTRFLSYAHSKDVLPTVKKLLSARGDVITDDRTNALIIQDIPSVIPEVDRLLATLDRKTQEVEIEARVVAATRNFARDIGFQLGFGWGNGRTAVGGGAGKVGASPITATAGPNGGPPPPLIQVAGKPGVIPLFSDLPAVGATSGLSLINLGSNYRIDAILTMAESRGLLKVLSRPRIVTQNNIQAIVRQGLRVPVVTLGQLGGPPTVSYIDAFLRLTVTPQVTAENTIFLNVDVENTTADFGHQVQGNPTLITQQATTQVLVTDGGTVVIGGVIQTQNSVTVDQVPLLGDIPVVGNLFKRRAKSSDTQELIFFITPKIIQT